MELSVGAVYDDGWLGMKRTFGAALNKTLAISLPLSARHYGQKIPVDISQAGLRLRFSLKISIDCSPGYYPPDKCTHYTGCVETAPCVKSCSVTGQASCDSDCFADVGPCARRECHTVHVS